VLLGRGALPEAAREFASSLRAGSRTRFSVQMLTACAPETVQKAVGAAGAGELIVLPVTLNGRACYRLCWGVYDDRQRAEAALATIPAYFRQGGAKPRVSALAELLP
jgi:septal ring-binding cell division protein DamX